MNTIDDYLAEFDDVFVKEENEGQTLDGSGSPYPDTMTQNRGVFHQDLDDDEFINREMNKVLGCGNTALCLEGKETLARYLHFIHCMRWFCPDCGTKGGRIHNKRIKGIIRKLQGMIDQLEGDVLKLWDMRQVIFTIPKEWRSMFLTRKAINALYRIVERIIKEEFPGRLSIAYLHAFGDKDKSQYHPHMNVHIFEERGQRLEISPEVFQRLKVKFYMALVHYGCRKESLGAQSAQEGISRMNVHYSFVMGDKAGKMFHRIKYMARTNPGYVNYSAVKKDPVLKALFMGSRESGGMQGFQYIRYFNGFKKSGEKDIDRKEEIKERESLAGEGLRVVRDRDGHIMYKTKTEVELLHKNKDLEELGDGFYRVKPGG